MKPDQFFASLTPKEASAVKIGIKVVVISVGRNKEKATKLPIRRTKDGNPAIRLIPSAQLEAFKEFGWAKLEPVKSPVTDPSPNAPEAPEGVEEHPVNRPGRKKKD
jgi:hypothetical protein